MERRKDGSRSWRIAAKKKVSSIHWDKISGTMNIFIFAMTHGKTSWRKLTCSKWVMGIFVTRVVFSGEGNRSRWEPKDSASLKGLETGLYGKRQLHGLDDERKCPMNHQFFQGSMPLLMQNLPKTTVVYNHVLAMERSQACIMHICTS